MLGRVMVILSADEKSILLTICIGKKILWKSFYNSAQLQRIFTCDSSKKILQVSSVQLQSCMAISWYVRKLFQNKIVTNKKTPCITKKHQYSQAHKKATQKYATTIRVENLNKFKSGKQLADPVISIINRYPFESGRKFRPGVFLVGQFHRW